MTLDTIAVMPYTYQAALDALFVPASQREKVAPVLLPPFGVGGRTKIAVIDIDSDDREDGSHDGGAMIYNTTRRGRVSWNTATYHERAYQEIGNRFRLEKQNWGAFWDHELIQDLDVLNEGAAARVDAIERAGYTVIFLTSMPDSCMKVRKQMLIRDGLLPLTPTGVLGWNRGLICKPTAICQFLRTDWWKALVISGIAAWGSIIPMGMTRSHAYEATIDLAVAFPWMIGGLIGLYRPEHVLFVDDDAPNAEAFMNTHPFFVEEQDLTFHTVSSLKLAEKVASREPEPEPEPETVDLPPF